MNLVVTHAHADRRERGKIVNIIKKMESEGKIAIGKGRRRKADKIDKIQMLETASAGHRLLRRGAVALSNEAGRNKHMDIREAMSISDYENKARENASILYLQTRKAIRKLPRKRRSTCATGKKRK